MGLVIAASIVASGISASPALAQPAGYVAILRPEAVDVNYSLVERSSDIARSYAPPRLIRYQPNDHDRFDPFPVAPGSADVLPSAHEDDQPTVELMPETAHYDHAPSGLDDDPTTFGLVAKF